MRGGRINGGGGGWHGRFRGQGYRMTESRQAIIDVLSGSEGLKSAEDIYMEVHRRYPAIGLTTVYRTLELLVSMGLALKHNFGDGRARFERAESPKGRRRYLVCTVCGSVSEIPVPETNESADNERILEEYGFAVTNSVEQIRGICRNCRGK